MQLEIHQKTYSVKLKDAQDKTQFMKNKSKLKQLNTIIYVYE